jgi:hypothetical protein
MVAASRSIPQAGGDTLMLWAERSGHRRISELRPGGLRFAFYGRVSTEDYQDPVTSRARQRDQAAALVAGFGLIVAEFFDAGQSRVLAWLRRPQGTGWRTRARTRTRPTPPGAAGHTASNQTRTQRRWCGRCSPSA